MKSLFILAILLANLFGEDLPLNPNQCPIFEDHEYTYLISFQRSGNTFCRFLIEYLLKVPTGEGKTNHIAKNKVNSSLGILLDFEVDFSLPPVLKKHDFINYYWFMQSENHLIDKGKVIFLLRNPLRHNYNSTGYFNLLREFDLHKGEKMLIYFEDLISDPLKEIKKISTFINRPICEQRLIEYQNNQEKFHRKCANIYSHYAIPVNDTYKDPNAKIKNYLEVNNLKEEDFHAYYYTLYTDLYEKYLSKYYIPATL